MTFMVSNPGPDMTRDPSWSGRVAAAGGWAARSLIRSANWTGTAGRRVLAAAASFRIGHTARGCHHLVREFEHWGIFLAMFGVWMAFFTIVIDLEDRQAERTFRAWQLVLTERSAGSSQREALEYLNQEFDGTPTWRVRTCRMLT